MTISKALPIDVPKTFGSQAVALAWGAWVELGVSGWTTTHRDWAIDPEPLIVFTAWLGHRDARLLDEATDWCIRNWRFVSKTRLKNLVRSEPQRVRDEFGDSPQPLAPTPALSGQGQPSPVDTRQRSGPPHLTSIGPRWRGSAFGQHLALVPGLRSCGTSSPGGDVSAGVATIAAEANYTKRNVASECDALAQAGVLRVGDSWKPPRLLHGETARGRGASGWHPRTPPQLVGNVPCSSVLVELEDEAVASTDRTLAIKAHQAIDAISSDLQGLDVDRPPSTVHGRDLWIAAQALGGATLLPWSLGETHERSPWAKT
jgi:hypothetical protein